MLSLQDASVSNFCARGKGCSHRFRSSRPRLRWRGTDGRASPQLSRRWARRWPYSVRNDV